MAVIRFWFEKTGRLKFISHLDVNRTVCRCIKLAGLPIQFSNGFNPRPLLTFALPLSLGVESLCEIMDMKLDDGISPEDALQRLNRVMPDGLKVFRAAEAVHDPKAITRAGYRLVFSGEEPQQIARRFEQYWAADEITVIKKNKSGEHPVNLKQSITVERSAVTPDGFAIDINLPAGVTENLNPSLLADHFIAGSNCCCGIIRTAVYLADGKEFD